MDEAYCRHIHVIAHAPKIILVYYYNYYYYKQKINILLNCNAPRLWSNTSFFFWSTTSLDFFWSKPPFLLFGQMVKTSLDLLNLKDVLFLVKEFEGNPIIVVMLC